MIGKPRGAFDLVAACAVNSDSSDPYLPALFSALLAQRGPGQNNPKPFGGEPPISLKNSDRVLHLVDCAPRQSKALHRKFQALRKRQRDGKLSLPCGCYDKLKRNGLSLTFFLLKFVL